MEWLKVEALSSSPYYKKKKKKKRVWLEQVTCMSLGTHFIA
jgi:hypothetical protein